jgi:hypothetical protein
MSGASSSRTDSQPSAQSRNNIYLQKLLLGDPNHNTRCPGGFITSVRDVDLLLILHYSGHRLRRHGAGGFSVVYVSIRIRQAMDHPGLSQGTLLDATTVLGGQVAADPGSARSPALYPCDGAGARIPERHAGDFRRSTMPGPLRCDRDRG